MPNVVPFRKRDAHPLHISCSLTVDPDAPLEDGCLIAFQFKGSSGILVDQYLGRRRRGEGGRFVNPGDPGELHWLGSLLSFSDDNLKRGDITILGRVREPMVFARMYE